MSKHIISHSICLQCWLSKSRPALLAAHDVACPVSGPCCWCDGVHASGIVVRGLWDLIGTVCEGSCDV